MHKLTQREWDETEAFHVFPWMGDSKMMHYRNGKVAKVGDVVVGRDRFNSPCLGVVRRLMPKNEVPGFVLQLPDPDKQLLDSAGQLRDITKLAIKEKGLSLRRFSPKNSIYVFAETTLLADDVIPQTKIHKPKSIKGACPF